jgi:hypothetical protein
LRDAAVGGAQSALFSRPNTFPSEITPCADSCSLFRKMANDRIGCVKNKICVLGADVNAQNANLVVAVTCARE